VLVKNIDIRLASETSHRLITPIAGIISPPAHRKTRRAGKYLSYYLGSYALNLTVNLFIVKDMLSFKIIFRGSCSANKKIRPRFVLSIISYRTHQDRNNFTPLSEYGHAYILTARIHYNVATHTERYLRASETIQTSRNGVRTFPRRHAGIRPEVLALASLREPAPEHQFTY
jgi:hypothetical protein